MRAFGAPQSEIDRAIAVIEAAKGALQDVDEYPIYADNIPVVQTFWDLRTQWQRAGMSAVRVGLCYASAWALLDRLIDGLSERRETFKGLQLMEAAVLMCDAEQREKEER